MTVQDIMTTSPEACGPDDNLATAVGRLWAADCGALPIADDTGRVVGVITDRDICIALGTRNARASDVLIGSVMRTTVQTCRPDEDVLTALEKMAKRRVRRLPVVDAAQRLVGMLSLDDVVLATGTGRAAVRGGAVLDTFRAVCAPSVPVPVSRTA